ncbi:hypothetical protein THICB2_570044 [Thiomonas sp. CB2]|nr:hypothetical protein THICB2_570044 [Thiomonas sp. CB2]VDY04102.1 protein of unknown function [Thiomonas sp. Bio17B3]VDY08725.1 protein of unknown function [Thiomonas sp. Sup16B3]VDY12349.1 conserved protein of unknown function [Thiomonas sp. OC7]
MISRTRPVMREVRVRSEMVEAALSRFTGQHYRNVQASASKEAGAPPFFVYNDRFPEQAIQKDFNYGNQSRSQKEERSHPVGSQTRASIRQGQRRQHRAAFAFSHGCEVGSQGHRRWRSRQGDGSVQGQRPGAGLDRRQKDFPQEHRSAS